MQQPIFQIKNLTLLIKNQSVLSVTNFEVHRGITYAIIGQSGSGKTSLLEILANQRKPTSGTILYDGDPITSQTVKRKYHKEVFYLPQLPPLSKQGRGNVERYMLKYINTAPWSTDSASDRLKSVSKRMNLGDKLARSVKTLSPGERRIIDLAVCIASDAKVLIIDEIEQHMSYDELDLVKRQLQRKCNYEGTTALISTLNPTTTRRLTGVSVTLDHGRIAMIRSFRDSSRGRRSSGSGGNNSHANRSGSKNK